MKENLVPSPPATQTPKERSSWVANEVGHPRGDVVLPAPSFPTKFMNKDLGLNDCLNLVFSFFIFKPFVGIEPTAVALQIRCSTSELKRLEFHKIYIKPKFAKPPSPLKKVGWGGRIRTSE